MKKNLLIVMAICAAAALTSCKSKESAWQQAYNKASQNVTPTERITEAEVVEVAPVTNTQQYRPQQTQTQNTYNAMHDKDVRTIQGPLSVIKGNPLKTFSVVVGSFVGETNAITLFDNLKAKGFEGRVVKTNETINGHTGWYRVVASSFNDRESAINSRNALRHDYQGAWLLYRK